METTRIKPLLIILVMMIVTSLAASRIEEPQLATETGVRRSLPEQVGNYTAHEILYCSNEACGEAYSADEFGDQQKSACPLCGSALDSMAPVERHILPEGTEIKRAFYRNPDGAVFFVSVVISGQDRLSLHRPENCLPGQGLSIRNSRILKTPLQDGDTLHTRLLDVRRRVGGSDAAVFSHFTYWYTAPGRETPLQWRLYAWIALDRLLHARMDRWAYIAVARDFNPLRENESIQDLRGFLEKLRPLLIIPPVEP